jgi:hypothetical protein
MRQMLIVNGQEKDCQQRLNGRKLHAGMTPHSKK